MTQTIKYMSLQSHSYTKVHIKSKPKAFYEQKLLLISEFPNFLKTIKKTHFRVKFIMQKSKTHTTFWGRSSFSVMSVDTNSLTKCLSSARSFAWIPYNKGSLIDFYVIFYINDNTKECSVISIFNNKLIGEIWPLLVRNENVIGFNE